MKADYKHVQAQIFNHSFWSEEILPSQLKNRFQKALLDSGFNIITFNEHHFPEQGYTCFWLLGESHLAIHTFPESKTSYIEISSCNKDKLEKFIKECDEG